MSVILGIETSCDETSAAVMRGREVLSNVIHSQIEIHKVYGGVVPEIASRNHILKIDSVVMAAMEEARVAADDIDAVAVTYGPGLVGALLVGVNFAKALAYAWGKPLVAVHHIAGHIASCYINSDLEPPFMAFIVSGGHTQLILVKDYLNFEVVGRSLDDAAGEAFDKVARSLGLPYPGGRYLEELAKSGQICINFTKPRVGGLDFSFSGLKSAVLNHLNQAKMRGEDVNKADIAASFQKVVVEALVDKAAKACKEYNVDKLALAGGVACNNALREGLVGLARIYAPAPALCTDNAAMIAMQGALEYSAGRFADMGLNAKANLSL